MVKHKVTHGEHLVALRRIEGQVGGIQRMINEEKYCFDIVIQIHAVVNALYRVSEKILQKHIEHCVVEAFKSRSQKEKNQKINEIMGLVKKIHKTR